YIKCANSCRQLDIVPKCGYQAFGELSLLYRSFIIAVKLLMSLYHAARTGSELIFDDNCDMIGIFTT
uniref:Uncharacterized protein n=1 Tax=Romanomermis culicivorax TaxID=13658 RepID=A0A915KBD8_ROMCU